MKQFLIKTNKMKHINYLLVAATIFISLFSRADEGMWFLMNIERLNHRDMEKMGLQLTSEEIYSINNSSLKDAIVQFDGGCTAELISKEGLVLTNHHCGYNAIAELSTPENDYLTDGFWAKSKSEELKPAKLSVRFFVRMDDVTKRILSKLNDSMSEEERNKAIKAETALIEKENNEGGKYIVSVRSFFQGNEFYYFVYQDYTDVRLVGNPPASIGKFGGDTDNWEWPRHTGDFSMFRVYADKDGNPSEYSENNIPLTPKKHLKVNIGGVQEDDFAMILGYPGRTNRWMPAAGIEQNVKFAYPAWVESSKLGMDRMKIYMDKDDEVRLNYAGVYAGVANYWKNRQGMIDALTKAETSKTKAEKEAEFNKWANKKKNKDKYGDVITIINKYYSKTNLNARHNNYLTGLLRTCNFSVLPYRFGAALNALIKEEDSLKQVAIKQSILGMMNDTYKTLYIPLEKDILAAQLNLYATKGSEAGLAKLVAKIGNENSNDFKSYVNKAFENSIFGSKKSLEDFLNKPSKELLEKDPLYLLSMDLLTRYRSRTEEIAELEEKYEKAYRNLVEGLRISNPKMKYYPDANSTLRLSYGKVCPLPPDVTNDAEINYYTTLQGTVAKYKENDPEFDLPQRLRDLYRDKDFGRYEDKNGYMPVNFLTDNDITGGNSGSPVLNGKGELIGLAFDGNIEAMAGDVIFDDKLQKTINVDIRYVLFIIEKYANAKHIVDEMDIVK
jgi:hypothetical protein